MILSVSTCESKIVSGSINMVRVKLSVSMPGVCVCAQECVGVRVWVSECAQMSASSRQ